MIPFTLPLSDSHATLENVGGKGLSLAKMIQAGFPVPDGFHVTTDAYRAFVDANNLQTKILSALNDADPSLPETLEAVSATICGFFADAPIPTDIANAIKEAYLKPDTSHPSTSLRTSLKPVAVRSSATAEDLPEASFAGQQETYLNIHGIDEVLDAVKKCWASLWTARAIAYRIKKDIDQKAVALAVVVQEMVDAEAAGILFTANPINGRRDEMVINAAWGLGEAIVGGLVSPDTIVAEKATGKVKQYEVAEKTVITVLTEKGTREDPLEDARRSSKVMNEAEVVELVNIARRIESYYGSPQDIEWCRMASPSPAGREARGEGIFCIVQSRPITALPEIPIEWTPPKPKGVYMRASVVDLMPGPLSPLFVTMGIPAQMAQMKPLGRRLTGADPVLHDDYYTSINNFAYMNAAFPAKAWWWILTSLVPMFVKTFGKLGLFWRDQLHPEYQAFVASKRDISPEQMSVDELWHEAQEFVNASASYVCGLLFATMGAAAGAELLATNAYNKMAKREGDPDASTLLMGWDNIPVRAEKSLYDLAMWARENDELAKYLLETPTEELVGQLPPSVPPSRSDGGMKGGWDEFVSRFQSHLDQFGHIIFQLDFAEPLPFDNPAPMLENIKMYLRGEGTNPHERQKASEQKRIQTGETMLHRLKGFKRWAFTKALNYGQSMAAVREDALAEIGLGYPMLRRILHELGSRFVEAGVIEKPSDIYLLEKSEIDALAGGAELRLAGLVAERKAYWDRLRKETPPPMMPMKKKYMGIDTSVWLAESERNRTSNILKGVPTSAGKVTAPACVLRGPEDFNKMRASDVLVAGTTTPAWTPLFAMASAVVTDIGGPLSHGSIVAREYGIPAVMGTGVATKRIQSGQVITVDGTKGEVILETKEGQAEQPVPPTEWKRPHPKAMYARASFAEHLPNAVSPLFGTLGLRAVNQATAELEDLMKIDLVEAEYQYRAINGYVYMGVLMTAKFTWTMLKLFFTGLKFMFGGGTERWLEARKKLAGVIAKWDEKKPEVLPPSELLTGARELMYAAGKLYTVIQSGTLPTASSSEIVFTRVYKMVSRKDEPKAETLLFGLDAVPLRAEKSQYDLGMWIRERPALRDFTLQSSTGELVAALRADSTPEAIPAADWNGFKSRFEKHLDEFGRTAYELDFMNPTPAETPELIFDAVKMYVEGKGSDPYARQREVIERREQTVKRIRNRFKLIPNHWFDKSLKWAMDTGPTREDSLADMGMGYTTIRRLLGELGKRMVDNGALEHPEDIYWLVEEEVEELASLLERNEKLPNHSSTTAARKAEWCMQMKLVPPPMLPEKSRWAKLVPGGKGTMSGNVIKGLGASAGKVTATARVLFSPEDFGKMKQGDVLVAVITTPAWTPLFTMASAVVTDIGGPLSHSSIVAREYGIPAVLATGVGTRRILDGQTVTVDGTKGEVILETSKEGQTEQPAPPLEWRRFNPKAVYARGSLAEHLPNAVSPLFGTLGLRAVNKATAELSDLMDIDVLEAEYQYRVVNGYVYMGFLLNLKFTFAMTRLAFTGLKFMFTGGRERWLEARRTLAGVIAKWDEKNHTTLSPSEILDGARELTYAAGKYYTLIQSGTLPSASSSEIIFTSVYKMVKRKDDPDAPTLLFGLETVPLRAEKSLFDLGMWIRERPALRDLTLQTPTVKLVAALTADSYPETVPAQGWDEFKSRFEKHLDEFGHTSYEFDFMNPTPAETPELIIKAVKAYVEGKGSDPYARQREVTEKREQTLQKIRSRFKLIPNRWFNKSFQWAIDTGPAREDSLADMGMGHTTIRRLLGELGKRFVANGALENAEDIYWLVEDEVDNLSSLLERGEHLPDHVASVSERKAAWHQQMKLVPPAVIPQNSSWAKVFPWSKENASGNVIKGLGASAGKVTATARLLFSPEDFNKMKQGDVLVAVTTTPAWTPLFTLASAVVTDIGGPLSHSSIVAREYGIPAVLATGVATRRIKDGQTITVDGGAGTVTLL